MRFYSAVNDGKLTHHTVRLGGEPQMPPACPIGLLANSQGRESTCGMTMPEPRLRGVKQEKIPARRGRQGFNLAGQITAGDAQRLYQTTQNGDVFLFFFFLERS